MKNLSTVSSSNLANTDLVERLTSVSEQLEDIVMLTKGKRIKEPNIALGAIANQMKKKIGGQVPLVLFAIFRTFALKNLLRGRMHHTAYSVGRQLGLSLKIETVNDLKNELEHYGFGKVIIERLDARLVKIKLDGTITSMGIRNSGQPICYFEKGFLSGACESILKKKVELEESTCCSQGDPYCYFSTNLSGKKGGLDSVAGFGALATEAYSKENIRLLTTLATHSLTAIENTVLFEEAKRQSVTDGLTHVYNQRYFDRALKVEVSRSLRHKTPLALIMMDIDKFKNYNDRYGHEQGNWVLKKIASIIVENVREIDLVARYGGDEFAIILPHTDTKGARLIANRILQKVSHLKFKSDGRYPGIPIGISAGCAMMDGKKFVRPNAIFKKADRNLLRAKRLGRNKVAF